MKNTFYKKRGYSIAEVVITMAVIMMISLATVAACYVGTKIQANAESNLRMTNISQEIARQFVLCAGNVEDKTDEANKQKFILDFNSRLSFVLNSWEPNMKNFSDDKTLDEAWNINLILEEEGKYQEENGKFDIVKVPVVGLDANYLGVDRSGRTYSFNWKYYTRTFEMEIIVSVRGGTWYLTINGKYSGGRTNAVELQKAVD